MLKVESLEHGSRQSFMKCMTLCNAFIIEATNRTYTKTKKIACRRICICMCRDVALH